MTASKSTADKPYAGKPIAILSALAEEQGNLIEELSDARCIRRAGRDFWCGNLEGRPVVLALSRIGKVAAATTATALIESFGVGAVLFTGVAGGVGQDVKVGDVVVGEGFIQHDMDASPLFPKYEIPLYGTSVLHADARLSKLALQAAQKSIGSVPVKGASVHHGLIASGDRFVSTAGESANLVHALRDKGHEPLAVEMEGAAVAQVCCDYGVPFAVTRTISDRADASAHADFSEFVREVGSVYSRKIVLEWLRLTG